MKLDLSKSHRCIVGKFDTSYMQNGQIFDSKGRVVGSVTQVVSPKGYFNCKFCGGTFTTMIKLEEHIYAKHGVELRMRLAGKKMDHTDEDAIKKAAVEVAKEGSPVAASAAASKDAAPAKKSGKLDSEAK